MFRISVIIPTFNRAHSLPRALHSVLNQTLPPEELIVVDDGSNDNTEALIRETFPQVRYIRQVQQGVSAARNRGIEMAQGDWIALLDSDDEWLPSKLEHQVQLLKKNPEYKVCHTEEIWIRNGVRVNQMNKHKKVGGWIYQQCLPLCAMSPSSIVLHKSLLEDVGNFKEELPACEDYDLWLRICARYPVLYIEQPCIKKYGGHEDQLSQKHWGMDRFRIQALANMLDMNVLNENDEQATRKMLKKKINIFLKGARKHGNDEAVAYYSDVLSRFQLGGKLR